MRWILLVMASVAWSQGFSVQPLTVRQGETIHVEAPAAAHAAEMNGRHVRLFPQSSGGTLGLMPVPALEKPGRYELHVLGGAGEALQTVEITVLDAHFRTQNVVLAPEIAGLKPAPGEMETVAAFRNNISETRYWSEPLANPVPGCMTSPFGVQRLRNGKPTGDFHTGLDQRHRRRDPGCESARRREELAHRGGTRGEGHSLHPGDRRIER